jgi:DNA-binding CsgD family transcriptional regulator
MELLERDEAVASLRWGLAQASSGSGRAVFLLGEAGLGKSSLLTTAADLAAGDGGILRAFGSLSETELPFAYLEQLLPGAFPAADDDAVRLGPLERRSWAQRAALTRLRDRASAERVVLLLDDLHWADPDSLDVIGFLARRLGDLPVLMVGGLRPWPAAAAHLVDTFPCDRLPLASLSREATGCALTEHLGGKLSEPLLERAWELTGGNPQLITEAARIIHADGGLPVTHPNDERPIVRRILVLSHLAGLPHAAISCARAASVLGNRFRIGVVEGLVDLPPTEFAAAFDSLALAGIVREIDAGQAEFTHEMLARAVYDDIAPVTRRLLHRRAFDHLFATGDRLAAAAHAVSADLVGDVRAIEALADAGSTALARGAVATGLRNLSAAISLAGPEPDEGLLARYADALFITGRAADSIEASQRLLRTTRRPDVARAANERLTRSLVHLGRLDQAIARYDELVESSSRPVPGVLVMERAHAIWERDGPAAALVSIDAVLADGGAPDTDDVLRSIRALFALEAGDASGLPLIERVGQRARQRSHPDPGDVMASMSPLSVLVAALGALERYDEALTVVDECVSWVLGVGGLRMAIPLRTVRVGILVQQGHLEHALSEADQLFTELDVDPLARTVVEGFRARALVLTGRTAEARAAIDAVAQLPGVHSWYARMNVAIARGQLLRAERHLEEAADCFAEVFAMARRFGLGEPRSPAWAAGAVEAFLDAGRYDAVAEVTEWLAATGGFASAPWSRMVASGAQAGCAAAAGADSEVVEAHYTAALAVPCRVPLDRAAIQLRYGSWLRRRGRSQQARGPLAEAVRTAEACGARYLAEQSGAELRASGGRRRRESADDGALTPQESRVARLAATGATTPEIASALVISPRTVETHLARTFAKLGVKDRRELRRRAAELPL